MRLEWTPLIVAVVALLGTIFTGWRVSGRKDRATIHVERADAVVEIQAAELGRLDGELKKSREREQELASEISKLRDALKSVSGRVALLEAEVVRLGGDPALVL